MTRYADPLRCPDCTQPIAYGAVACPSCGLPLRGLTAQRLFQTLSTADDLLMALRASAALTAAGGTTAVRAPAGVAAGSAEGAPAGVAAGGGVPLSPAGQTGAPLPGPAPEQAAEHRGLSAASVPKILLTLGAACLLIAALVFLAVTWSVMDVAGRTATLVGFTIVTGGLAALMARRGLRGAAEALSLVSLGLLTLDTFGARAADWLGDIGTPSFFVVLGALLAVSAAAAALGARRTPAGDLAGAQLVAGAGVALAGIGVSSNYAITSSVSAVLAVLLAGGAGYLAHRLTLALTTAVAALAAGLFWWAQLASGLQAVSPPTLQEMWLDLDAWQLLASAALAGAVVAVREVPLPGRVAAAALAYGVLTLTAVLPALDESATAATLAALGSLLAAGLVAWFLPRPWGQTSVLTQAVAGVAALVAMIVIGGLALTRMVEAATVQWAGTTGGRLVGADWEGMPAPWLAPLCLIALLGTGLTLAKASAAADRVVSAVTDLRVAAALLAGSLVATLASYEVPVWTVLLALVAAGAGFVAWWVVRQSLVPLSLAAVFLAAAVALGWYDEWLTVVALAALLVAAAVVHLRARSTDISAVAGALAAAAVAGSVWTWGALVEASAPWVAVVGLGLLAAKVLTLHLYPDEWWACASPVIARAGVEVGAAAAALPLGLVGALLADSSTTATWTAIYLTVAGAAVSALALIREDRRRLGWLGGALLALASWVRLWDIGVREPEAYTLPTALVLLTLGLLHLRRDPGSSTTAALASGLGLALVPSLLWVLADPIGLRALLLGLACLTLVVVGVKLQWTAPLTAGALVGGIEVVRLAAPYIGEALPRWVLIGAAGAVLILMGVTWERRLQEARHLVGYVRGLR